MSDSQPLPQTTPRPAPKVAPKAARPAPHVAFDPLDPQWQNSARGAAPASDATGSGPSGSARQRAATPARSVEEVRRQEQADAVVMQARRAFVRGDLNGAGEQIKQAFAIETNNAAGLELLGDIYLSEAEQEKAIAVFERGRKAHPEHAAFEEKIGLALLDIEQEKSDRELAQLLLDQPDLNRWAERKPTLAATLSLMVPGAGQFYNDEPERGAAFLGAALLSFGGWYWLFNAATSNLPGRTILGSPGQALAQMSGLAKLGFWVLWLAWLAVVVFAAWDAYRGAVDANRAHRPFEV